MRITTALLIVLALTVHPVEARELKGRVFLGPGLSVCLEESRSAVADFFRAVSLLARDVPVVNLSALSTNPDQLVLGSDKRLYASVPGGYAAIGSIDDASRIALAEGVTIKVEGEAVGAFTGEGPKEKLVVEVPSGFSRVAAPERASFAHWLTTFDECGRDASGDRAPTPAHVFLANAIATSLPTGPKPTPAQCENLKTLASWLKSGACQNRALFQQFLRRLEKDSQRSFEAAGTEAEARRLLAVYEGMLAGLRS